LFTSGVDNSSNRLLARGSESPSYCLIATKTSGNRQGAVTPVILKSR
jgi:hypothetical protein